MAGWWPGVQVIATGGLDQARLRWLIDALGVVETRREQGPVPEISIAHREVAHDAQRRIIVDLSRPTEASWVITAFFDGEPLTDDMVGRYRDWLREVVRRLDLSVIKIEPPETADDLHLPEPQPTAVREFPGPGTTWDLPYQTLSELSFHLDITDRTPADVARAKLEHFTRQPVWQGAPPGLRREVAEYLAGTGSSGRVDP